MIVPMDKSNLLMILCHICCEKGVYDKVGMSVTVKSGKLRISTYLCQEHQQDAEDAEDVQDKNPFLTIQREPKDA